VWAVLLAASAVDRSVDPESVLQSGLALCRKGGKGRAITVEVAAKTGRPRLLPSLPHLDYGRYCDCLFERRRSEFGVQTSFELVTAPADLRSRLGDVEFVRVSSRDEYIDLDCIELGATGAVKFSDPEEGRLADLIDVCANNLQIYSMLSSMFLGTPGRVNPQAMALDRPQVCSCFYEGQRKEFGLEKALLYNSMVGATDMAVRAEQEQLDTLGKKVDIFRACAGLPARTADGEKGRPEPAARRPPAGSPAPRGEAEPPRPRLLLRRGPVAFAAAMVVVGAVLVAGAVFLARRGRRGRAPARRGGYPSGRPRP
jgi:hypothetical protein